VQLEELRHEQGKMAHEKEVLENQLEAEQEYIVHKLQKQAAHIAAERQALQLEKGDLKRQVCLSLSSLITCSPAAFLAALIGALLLPCSMKIYIAHVLSCSLEWAPLAVPP
jgi:hypothetical protein